MTKRVQAVTVHFDDGTTTEMKPESHDAVFSTVTYASRNHTTSKTMHIRSEVRWTDDVIEPTQKGRSL